MIHVELRQPKAQNFCTRTWIFGPHEIVGYAVLAQIASSMALHGTYPLSEGS